MEDIADGAAPAGMWVSTVHVSSEPVRSNAVPVIKGWASGLADRLEEGEMVDGALAMRQMEHIVTTREGADIRTLELDDFVQVVEYDPVRHVAMVIGTRDAPQAMPVLWLMHRVFPGAAGVAVLPRLWPSEEISRIPLGGE